MPILNLDDHQVYTLLRALDALEDGGGAVASAIRAQANLCPECDRPRDQAGHCPVCDKGCDCDDDAGFADDRDQDDGQPDSLKERQDFAGDDDLSSYADDGW